MTWFGIRPCDKIAAIANCDASVVKMKSSFGFGSASTGGLIIAFFNKSKLCLQLSVQIIGMSFLHRL